MHLHELTTAAAEEVLDGETIAVLPVGSVEQHGPALPLGTDLIAADGIAGAIDREQVVVLPAVPVGVSRHHHQFSGTLSVTPETFESYVEDVLAGLADHGVRKAVIVNGHGGNTEALRRIARRVRDAETMFAVPWNWWDGLDEVLAERFDTELSHADAIETSLMLELTDLVRTDQLENAQREAADAWGQEIAGADVGFDTIDFAPNGVVGKPTEASLDHGEALREAAVADLETLVDWLIGKSFAELRPKPHR